MFRYVEVVRAGHPLSRGRVTAKRYASFRHAVFSWRGIAPGPIDDALVATVPERHTDSLRIGMPSFSLPFAMPEFAVSLLRHPRLDEDPAHRWLRACVRVVVTDGLRGQRTRERT